MTHAQMSKLEKRLYISGVGLFFTVPPVYWTFTGDITPAGAGAVFTTVGFIGFTHSMLNRKTDEEKIPSKDMRLARYDEDW